MRAMHGSTAVKKWYGRVPSPGTRGGIINPTDVDIVAAEKG
jgi:hypothetical protein